MSYTPKISFGTQPLTLDGTTMLMGSQNTLIETGPSTNALPTQIQPAQAKPAEPYTMETVVVEAEETYSDKQKTEQEIPAKSPEIAAASSAPSMDKVSPPPAKTAVTSIVDDYDWTLSVNKSQLSNSVPRIILTEFNITASNVMQSLQAGLMAWSDLRAANAAGVKAMGSVAGGMLADAANAAGRTAYDLAATADRRTEADAAGNKINEIKKFLDDQADGKLGNFVKGVGTAVTSVVDKAESYAKSKFASQAPSFGPGGSNLVSLYGDIYARKATGQTYIFPFFSSDYLNVSNTFGDTYQHLDELKQMIDKVVSAYEQVPALVEPGVYVQRPKFYQFSSSNVARHKISFNLFNTITPMAYVQNAAFIQKLALSNMPRRKTRVVVDPPCIYEVLIPGKAFYPYCYIDSMTVKHLGTKRLIGGEIIPDAYEIEIELISLLSEASNFYAGQMQHLGAGVAQELGGVDTAAPTTDALSTPPQASDASFIGANAQNGGETAYSQVDASIPTSNAPSTVDSAPIKPDQLYSYNANVMEENRRRIIERGYSNTFNANRQKQSQ